MEKVAISLHEVRIVRFMQTHKEWATSKEVAAGAHVAERTARHHLKRLLDLGMAEVAVVFPGHRYRLSARATQRSEYARRVQAAFEAFGKDV